MKHIALALILGLTALACTDDDIGADCELDDLNASTEETPTSDPAVVEINTQFPCESLTCVSTDGRSGYCSRECRSDTNCPSAFSCEQVTDLGLFSDRTFCVWRSCRVDFECGDVNRYECRIDEGETEGVCDFN